MPLDPWRNGRPGYPGLYLDMMDFIGWVTSIPPDTSKDQEDTSGPAYHARTYPAAAAFARWAERLTALAVPVTREGI